MKILKVKFHPIKELVSRLRQVSMLTAPDVKPYTKAEISITDLSAHDLAPAQLYVLQPELMKVRDLRWAMLEGHGVDVLRLSDSRTRDGAIVANDAFGAEPVGFVEVVTDHGPDTITVLPPVVERWQEADKAYYNIINDGMHRCYLARTCHMRVSAVTITKIPPELPYYAYPLVGGWNDVTMIDSLKGDFIKKFHRVQNYKCLYRNFDSAFQNVGGPRGKG